MFYQIGFFDTGVDTTKFSVPIKTKFVARKDYVNKNSESRLYLFISGEGPRRRLSLDLYVDPEHFCPKRQRLTLKGEEAEHKNLVIDNYKARVTHIITTAQLTGDSLTVNSFVHEFINGIPRTNFWAFANHYINQSKGTLKPGTIRRYRAVIAKGIKYREQLTFNDLTLNELRKFASYLSEKGNISTTINSNMAVIKRLLNAAKKNGIRLKLDIKDIKVGSTKGKRIDLSQQEVKRLMTLYRTEEVLSAEQHLILGYFLFCCFTGLRISELLLLEKSSFDEEYFTFYEPKKDRLRKLRINRTTEMIMQMSPNLFVQKFTGEHMNREIKNIISLLKIKKPVSFHVARHTFATNFIRMGGEVTTLQMLLGHSKLSTTMEYVHLVEQERNMKVFLLDKLIE